MLATPRSGSSLVYAALAWHLFRRSGVIPLSEAFNVYQNLQIDGETLRAGPFDYSATFTPERAAEIERERVDLVTRAPGAYFFKVMPGQLSTFTIKTWLLRHYEPVFVERRNLFEQYVSLLISMTTGKWHAPGPIRFTPASLNVSPSHARWVRVRLEEMYTSYLSFKLLVPSAPVLVYEEFSDRTDPAELCRRAGIPEPADFSAYQSRLSRNPPLEEKLACFTEPELVIAEYRRSKLSELFGSAPATFANPGRGGEDQERTAE
ncbi:MAG TPA: hypothetical protein VFV50_13770 [Bdellovibrionales bacterium]|nr:hypothetical protein [Bdellovibrionales bacterium]